LATLASSASVRADRNTLAPCCAKQYGDGAADAATGAGDHGSFVFEKHGVQTIAEKRKIEVRSRKLDRRQQIEVG
jgi:hypothetical protein